MSMSRWRFGRHLSVALLAATMAGGRITAQDPADPSGSATFLVLLQGVRIGTESLTIARTGSGWVVTGTGRLQPPVDLTTDKIEISYGTDWQPRQLSVEASLRGQPQTLATSFGLTTATNDVRRGPQKGTVTHQVTPRAVVLPGDFFAGYELLAMRLAVSPVGTRIPVYVPGAGETSVTVAEITPRRVSLADRSIDLREFVFTLGGTTGATPVELWVDARGRLARLVMPTAQIVAIREDLATVMAREERFRHPRDDDAFIGADSFSLGSTLTPPASPTTRSPAVVLVSSPGPQDRDFVSYGVPIFGQLAAALSDAGYFVVRYDARGVGRSGGRAETSRLTEYAEDVIGVVKWLRKRKDIDERRVTILGYGDGGPVAILAASREKSIAGLVLVASPGRTGREVTLERQEIALGRLKVSDTDRASRVVLQSRIIDAVVTGKGWDTLPAEVRRDADSLWFKSWLEFDPAAAMRRIERPVLVLHGDLDAEVPAAHAIRLDALARARNKLLPADSQIRVVPGVNHLLVNATTGQVDEYTTLATRVIAPEIPASLVEWLQNVRRK